MTRNSTSDKFTKTKSQATPRNIGLSGKALIAVPGLIALYTSISSLQHLARFFADDVNASIMIANWTSLLATMFFALGWFTVHLIEIFLRRAKPRMAKILLIFLVIVTLVIGIYFHFLGEDAVFRRFESVSMLMIFSGGFLRYSTVRQKT